MTHSGNVHHLVYVRRKPEAETGSGSVACGTDSPRRAAVGKGNDKATRKEVYLKESNIPTAQASPVLDSPPLGFSSAKSPSAKLSGNCTSPSNLLYFHANRVLNTPTTVNAKHWEGRVCQLNNLLKKLDQSDQKDYVEMLRSLPSIELSKHAVELEKRSIQLSLDEAQEIQRVHVLDVLERYSKRSRAPSNDRNVSEK